MRGEWGLSPLANKDKVKPCEPCGYYRTSFNAMTMDEIFQEECSAYQLELDCLTKEFHFRCSKLKGPAKEECLSEFKRYMDELKCKNIPYFCRTPKPEYCK